jgi:hypothetical protein
MFQFMVMKTATSSRYANLLAHNQPFAILWQEYLIAS